MEYKLTKEEVDSANVAIEKILNNPVENIDLTDSIPPINDIFDSNKVFKGKLSILFIDMRKSTDLTDELKSKKMVKIYRSFIRLAIQAIRYCGGYSRQFAGDGVMGVFQDSTDENQNNVSSQKAINAAKYMVTMVDYYLNPKLKKHMNIVISCRQGIATGTIMITKVGMRGKESDDASDNEMGTVWVGSATNLASRLCSLADSQEIFADDNTIGEIECEPNVWEKVERIKGLKSYSGYVAKHNYLNIPDEINNGPILSEDDSIEEPTFISKIFREAKNEALAIVDDIGTKSTELDNSLRRVKERENLVLTKEKECAEKEEILKKLERQLDAKQTLVAEKELENRKIGYELYREIFSNTFCKKHLIVELGKDYWLDLISKTKKAGKSLGMSEIEIKSDLACYLVGIYSEFEMFEEAYDALCIQAEHGSWLNTSTVESIVKKSGHWYILKEILEKKMNPSGKSDYYEALEMLKKLGY
jgi:class 3 adenylate cyclase